MTEVNLKEQTQDNLNTLSARMGNQVRHGELAWSKMKTEIFMVKTENREEGTQKLFALHKISGRYRYSRCV